jgi:SAM-dependent methyltransferase
MDRNQGPDDLAAPWDVAAGARAQAVGKGGGTVEAAGEAVPTRQPRTAAEKWAEALRAWAVPEEILASAEEPPWGFPVQLFVDGARRALAGSPTPTHCRIAEALPEAGVLLDVGSGAGAASLPVAPRSGCLVAVDQDEEMLKALAALATEVAGTTHLALVAGKWPDVAGQWPQAAGQRRADAYGLADVAVAANVAYNVGDLATFVVALTTAARRRAVLELTAAHPLCSLNALWEHFWGLARPEGPRAEDAAQVVREVTRTAPAFERWTATNWPLSGEGKSGAAWVRRRLCLPVEREGEVADLLARRPLPPPEMVTMWWPGVAGD